MQKMWLKKIVKIFDRVISKVCLCPKGKFSSGRPAFANPITLGVGIMYAIVYAMTLHLKCGKVNCTM